MSFSYVLQGYFNHTEAITMRVTVVQWSSAISGPVTGIKTDMFLGLIWVSCSLAIGTTVEKSLKTMTISEMTSKYKLKPHIASAKLFHTLLLSFVKKNHHFSKSVDPFLKPYNFHS
jgi:hypothetical protein